MNLLINPTVKAQLIKIVLILQRLSTLSKHDRYLSLSLFFGTWVLRQNEIISSFAYDAATEAGSGGSSCSILFTRSVIRSEEEQWHAHFGIIHSSMGATHLRAMIDLRPNNASIRRATVP